MPHVVAKVSQKTSGGGPAVIMDEISRISESNFMMRVSIYDVYCSIHSTPPADAMYPRRYILS